MTTSAADVALYLLAEQDHSADERVSNLKLQKLLYYAQGYHLALFGEPLFEDEIVAWPHGPVVKSVYHTYADYDKSPIESYDPPPTNLPDKAVEVLDEIVHTYGLLPAMQLREMTHEELPWKAAHKGKISRATMENFFRTVLTLPNPETPTIETALWDPAFKASLDEGLDDLAHGRRVKWGEVKPSLRST